MKKIALIVTFFFIFSCNLAKKVYINTSFNTILSNTTGGKNTFGFEHITSNDSFLNLVNQLHLDERDDEKLLKVDFENNDVVVVYLGERNTGGFSIEIESLFWRDDILHIKTNEIKPEKGSITTMIMTSSYCITIIPKAVKIIVE